MTTKELDRAELGRHIDQLPRLADDPAYLVFADWLQAQGHRWGELIVLQHRAAHAATDTERAALEGEAARLLEERRGEILGELGPEGAELTWHLGFVRRAHLRSRADAAAVLAGTRALLAAPAARMLEELVLDPRPERFETTRDWGLSDENIVDPWPDWDALGPLVHERIERLGFGGWPASAASAYVRMPGFDPISRWLRKTARTLALTGSAPAGKGRLELLELVELAVRYADASSADLDGLAESKLPALERYAVSLGGGSHCILDDVYPPDEWGGGGGEDGEGEDEGDDGEDDDERQPYPSEYSAGDLESLEVHGVNTHVRADALRRFLDALPAGVTDFGVPSSMLGDELLDALVGHPRIPGLRRLDLSGCTISDRNIAILLDARAELSRIGAIDLSRNQITDRFRSRVATALPNAVIGEQGQEAPDFFMRYVATME